MLGLSNRVDGRWGRYRKEQKSEAVFKVTCLCPKAVLRTFFLWTLPSLGLASNLSSRRSLLGAGALGPIM